jgi:hypothetical protein
MKSKKSDDGRIPGSMGIRQYARRRGCSPAAVMKAIKTHRIDPLPNGRIDPVAADRDWAERTQPHQVKKSVSRPGSLKFNPLEKDLANLFNSHSPEMDLANFVAMLQDITYIVAEKVNREQTRLAKRVGAPSVPDKLSQFEEQILKTLNSHAGMGSGDLLASLQSFIYRLVPAAMERN